METLPPVLIVDDDPDDVFILKRLLSKAGLKNKVIAFEDVQPAVAYLEGESHVPNTLFIPWIVFTDLHMPNMSGVNFTKWIRSSPTLCGIVVIMVTSSENPEDQIEAEAAGVDRFVAKYPTVGVLEKMLQEF